VLLAPLAGIGNWFVRLQAKRYGAGMAVSEMVSSHAIYHRNEKTCREMLRIDPRERDGGPVAIQLFGEDPATMRAAAAYVVAAGADAIDINMGCPVPKVRKTGAGAELLADPDRAVAVARAAVEGAAEGTAALGPGARAGGVGGDAATVEEVRAREGTGGGAGGIPITVKLRSGLRPGDDSGFELARRLVAEAGVAAIGFHPRSAAVRHKGHPDYELAARLVEMLPAPVILTGGLDDPDSIAEAIERTGAQAVMLARGALGNPWLFSQLLGRTEGEPSPEEVRRELDWTIDRAVEHLGEARATRYLRKFYPWYVPRLGLGHAETKRLQEALQTAEELSLARALLELDDRSVAAPA
jgi:nifR3 family TIM-barrel protein